MKLAQMCRTLITGLRRAAARTVPWEGSTPTVKIKRLEISGFKSFADRMVFAFDEAITGVVGPNGCGKSNVVDAIRWAMGEQSAKQLRGREMNDVIFAGSESREPTSMAEVTVVFDTPDGLAAPEFTSFPEIAVTRRLFRT